MTIQGKHFIGGNWLPSEGPPFTAVNPASGQPLEPTFHEAGRHHVDQALGAAEAAFREVRTRDRRWPADLLDAIGREILSLGDEFLQRAHQETALPLPRLTAERARTVGQLALFAQVVREGASIDATIDTADPARQPMPKPDIRRMMIPRGPVVVFGASNFPFAFSVAGGDTASAFAAGNPVIVKGHPSHPGTSELAAQAIERAIRSLGLPLGLFALLQGASHELGAWLVQHPSTAAVGFTGSQRAGRALFDIAAARPRPIPVYAEMGSLNPLIVMPGAVVERGEALARELAGSILMGCGQFCTKPGLLLTTGPMESLLHSLAAHLAAAPPATMLNHSLRDNFLRRTAHWATMPSVAVRAATQPAGFAGVSAGLYETDAASFIREAALREEAFGPAALVVRCRDTREMVQVLHAVGGSLTGTVHAGSSDDPAPLLAALADIAGRVIVNGYPTGVEVSHAIVHGGPYPATTDPASTSVGTAAIRRFTRLVAYQNTPDALLPAELRNANPLKIPRLINGRMTSDPSPA
jgi:NADP-dependent aldehyde dehydrogenase